MAAAVAGAEHALSAGTTPTYFNLKVLSVVSPRGFSDNSDPRPLLDVQSSHSSETLNDNKL